MYIYYLADEVLYLLDIDGAPHQWAIDLANWLLSADHDEIMAFYASASWAVFDQWFYLVTGESTDPFCTYIRES